MTDNSPRDPNAEDSTDLEIITFENEEGEIIEFAQLVVFDLEGQTYAALCPIEDLEKGDVEMFLFVTGEGDGGRFYTPIEDEEKAQLVFEFAVELLGGLDGDA